MTSHNANNLTDTLEEYLEREKQALLAGDLEMLARLAVEKEKLLVEFAKHSNLTTEIISDLNAQLQANQALFDSALEGVRSVAKKLGAVRRARSDLQTYTRDGRKSKLAQSDRGQLEKRA